MYSQRGTSNYLQTQLLLLPTSSPSIVNCVCSQEINPLDYVNERRNKVHHRMVKNTKRQQPPGTERFSA